MVLVIGVDTPWNIPTYVLNISKLYLNFKTKKLGFKMYLGFSWMLAIRN